MKTTQHPSELTSDFVSLGAIDQQDLEQLRMLADQFRPNPLSDGLLRVQEAYPEQFDSLSTGVKSKLQTYRRQRTAAEILAGQDGVRWR